MTPEFTREEKVSELAREVAMRRNVYAGQVRKGKMTQVESDRRVGIMEAVLDDIKKLER